MCYDLSREQENGPVKKLNIMETDCLFLMFQKEGFSNHSFFPLIELNLLIEFERIRCREDAPNRKRRHQDSESEPEPETKFAKLEFPGFSCILS